MQAPGAGSPLSARRHSRCCVGPTFYIVMAPFVGLVAMMMVWVFNNEAKIVCFMLAFQLVTDEVREVGCERDPANDGEPIHLTCPLYHNGATDPGTGLHTPTGHKIIVRSRMLQWQERIHTQSREGEVHRPARPFRSPLKFAMRCRQHMHIAPSHRACMLPLRRSQYTAIASTVCGRTRFSSCTRTISTRTDSAARRPRPSRRRGPTARAKVCTLTPSSTTQGRGRGWATRRLPG